jgi:hypothetical protein
VGANGLHYVSAGQTTVVGTDSIPGDPRVASARVGGSLGGLIVPIPARYGATSSIPVASGIEARLIEAEAALAAHDVPTWASILNDLRAHAITPAIPPLTDDSTTTASDTLRENVLFRERAFWLYGTGHRHGDMRRLVRQYGRLANAVFPTGFQAQWNGFYGESVVLEPPKSEIDANPNYHGCLNRDA